MAIEKIDAANAGLPKFELSEKEDQTEARVFALSSHARAREALDFGLQARDPGFNIFVVGEDRLSLIHI